MPQPEANFHLIILFCVYLLKLRFGHIHRVQLVAVVGDIHKRVLCPSWLFILVADAPVDNTAVNRVDGQKAHDALAPAGTVGFLYLSLLCRRLNGAEEIPDGNEPVSVRRFDPRNTQSDFYDLICTVQNRRILGIGIADAHICFERVHQLVKGHQLDIRFHNLRYFGIAIP